MAKIDRRLFLTSAAVAGIALPESLVSASPLSGGYGAEAERITQATFRHFWDAKAEMFRAPVMSAEAVPSDPAHNFGYVFWPSQIALHSLAEGAKQHPERYAPQIRTVYNGLEKYFNPRLHAYTAWLHFEGNNDAYYDDNDWAVITLAEAYLATVKVDPAQASIYRDRAIDIMAHYIYGGWDDTGHPGGMRWGTDSTKAGTANKTVSATAGAALAALILARAGWNASFNIAWADSVLSWLWSNLRDTDNLILDGLEAPKWTVMKTKWTYNTGVPMRAYIEHYRLSGNPESLKKAMLLARAALNHDLPLYDGLVKDARKRFYYDGTYFVPFLLDGLLQVRQATPDKILAAAITAEGRREAAYAYNYIRDPGDGFYWRNWRLWRIGPEQLADWERLTGQTTRLDTDASEKSTDGKAFVKTLLANASASRLFWIASRF